MRLIIKIIIFACIVILPLLVAKFGESPAPEANNPDSTVPPTIAAKLAEEAQKEPAPAEATAPVAAATTSPQPSAVTAGSAETAAPSTGPAPAAAPPSTPPPLQKSRREGSPPFGLPVSVVESCEGGIDQINGAAVAPQIQMGNSISVQGWTTISGKDGTIPDAVYVTLSKADGDTAYFSSEPAARPDVKAHFGQPGMRDSGFAANIDTSGLSDRLTLGLARQTNGRIERCKNFAMLLYRDGSAPVAASAGPSGPPLQMSRREGSPPSGLPVSAVEACEGGIDHINGEAVAPQLKMGNSISAQGWMTISGKDGTTPDAVFVTLSKADGDTAYFSSEPAARPDVEAHFNRQDMRDPGFTANIDTSGLSDRLTLGLARQTNGRIERCENFVIVLYRDNSPPSTSPPVAAATTKP